MEFRLKANILHCTEINKLVCEEKMSSHLYGLLDINFRRRRVPRAMLFSRLIESVDSNALDGGEGLAASRLRGRVNIIWNPLLRAGAAAENSSTEQTSFSFDERS